MANDDFARGLVPLNTNGHGTVNSHYYQASTVTDIAIGMLVVLTQGRVSRAAVSGLAPAIGVALGFARGKGVSNELDPWLDVSDLSSDDWYVQVADDPSQEFFIQEDTGGTALTGTAAGQYTIDLLYQTTSIDAVSGIARLEIDATTALAGTGAPIHILRLHDYVNSDGTQNAVGDYAKWVVAISNHQKGNVNDRVS